VQKQTAWALAALYHSRFGGGRAARGGVSGPETGPPRRSLQGLPEEGAMRPLLTFLLTFAEGPGSEKGAGLSGRLVSESGHAASQSGPDQSASGGKNREGLEGLGVLDTVAAALRCLQKAPRLPALNWGVLIRRLFRAGKQDGTPRDSRGMQIRGECLRLAITHALEVPALAVFLDDTCELARLVTLETELQVLLLRGLAGILRALPRSGGLRVLGDLQDLVMGHEDAQKGRALQGALWRGLGEALEGFSGTEQKTEEVGGLEELRAAALEATKSLYRRLPVDVESFRGAALMQRAGGTSREYSEKGEGVWGAAVGCLAKTERAWLLELLKLPSTSQYGQSASPDAFEVPKEESEPQLRAVVARVLLASVSQLQLADLKLCRKWLLERLDCGDVHPSANSHPPSASPHSRNTHQNLSGQSGTIRSALETGVAGGKPLLDHQGQKGGSVANQEQKGGSVANQEQKGGPRQADLAGAVEELVGVLATARGAEKREWFMETLDWTLLAGRPLQVSDVRRRVYVRVGQLDLFASHEATAFSTEYLLEFLS
jgi:hypothetical protein